MHKSRSPYRTYQEVPLKKLLSFLLVFALLLVPFAVARGEEGPEILKSGDYQYALLEDGTAEIREYTGKADSLEIPDTLDGHPVTRIGYNAFSSCSSLTSIIIPDSVTAIGSRAFYWCNSLTSITIPDSVTSIGDDAFSWCKNLTSITVPDGVTAIGAKAFSGCTGLTSITIPDSVTSIGDSAFNDCNEALTITVPRGSYAAQYCKKNGLSYTYPDALDWLTN